MSETLTLLDAIQVAKEAELQASALYSNAVDVHVKNLRKKIGGRGDAQTIETIRGVGYRLKA